MRFTSYDVDGTRRHGDLAAWRQEMASDNADHLRRVKNGLRVARREELTPRQKEVVYLYFDRHMTVSAIARFLGLNRSTVSRTLRRAKRRLFLCLRYAW